jgi:hypothetical protein
MGKNVLWAMTVLIPMALAFPIMSQNQGFGEATVELEGTIIDTQYAQDHGDDLSRYLKVYTSKDALKPKSFDCGYSLYTGKRLYKFRAIDTLAIIDFLNSHRGELRVKVKVNKTKTGQELTLISITNQASIDTFEATDN